MAKGWVNAIEVIVNSLGMAFSQEKVRLSGKFTVTEDEENEEIIVDINGALVGEKGDKGDPGNDGDDGAPGVDGINAWGKLTLGFVIPEEGDEAAAQVDHSGFIVAGLPVAIPDIGLFICSEVASSTSIKLTNPGGFLYPGVNPGDTVPIGSALISVGAPGEDGTDGTDGINAWAETYTTFTAPSVSSTAVLYPTIPGSFQIGEIVYLSGGPGYYAVFNVLDDGAQLVLKNLGYPGNDSPGTSRSYVVVVPAGIRGAQGLQGNNAYGHGSGFTVPAALGTVTIDVSDSTWMMIGQVIYYEGAGYYRVISKPTSTSVTLENLGYAENVAPGGAISGAGVSPGGVSGPTLPKLWAPLMVGHTIPAVGVTEYIQIDVPMSFLDPADGKRLVVIGEAGLLNGESVPFWFGMIDSLDDSQSFYIKNIGGPGATASGYSVSSDGVLIVM